jgi:phage shock protein B
MSLHLFVLAIIFLSVVLPTAIFLHYVTKWKALKGLSEEEQRILEELWQSNEQMQSRLNSLETILDDTVPEWRSRG